MAVGTAAAPLRARLRRRARERKAATGARPGPAREQLGSLRERYAGLIAGVAGLLAAGTTGLAHLGAERSIPRPAGVEEATVAANAYGLTRLGGFQVPDALPDRVASVHLALYSELTGAADRHSTAAGALRELLLLFVVAGALSLFVLCRQFGLSTVTALGVVLLAYVAPALASAQVLVYSATLATTWLLVAAILLAARPTTAALTGLTRTLGVVLIALAALLTPVALLLPVGVLAVAVITGTLFPRWGLVRRVLSVAAVLVLLAAAGAAGFDLQPGIEDSAVPPSTLVALAAAGLVLAAVATWRVLWIRPLALGCVPLLAAALPPWDQQAAALVLSLPVIAVLFGAVVEEAVIGLRRPGPAVRRGIAAALVAAATVGLLVLPAAATDAVDGAPPTELAAWLAVNTAQETMLEVDPLLWVELMRAGVPARRLQRTDEVTADTPPTVLLAERDGQNADFPLVARFGDGPFVVDVRQRVADPVVAQTAMWAERVASQSFGAALADNPNVTPDDAIGDDLRSGNVDSRLLTVLATAAADFSFTIDSFPRTNGTEDAAALRTVRISEITTLAPGGSAASSEAILLRDFFRYQLQPYRPLSQGFDAGVLVVVYSAPSPVGVLS